MKIKLPPLKTINIKCRIEEGYTLVRYDYLDVKADQGLYYINPKTCQMTKVTEATKEMFGTRAIFKRDEDV